MEVVNKFYGGCIYFVWRLRSGCMKVVGWLYVSYLDVVRRFYGGCMEVV